MRFGFCRFVSLSFSTVMAVSVLASSAHAQEDAVDSAREPAGKSESAGRTRPAIADSPYQSDGFWLNAYYFVHSKTETWASLSQKLYGRSDRTDLLKKWNEGTHLKAGQVIYYNSPTRPDDKDTIKVFAEDFGYKLDVITIKKGDSLSKIGQELYGNLQTWREISALNPQIENPDLVEVGAIIKVEPRHVDTKPVLDRIIHGLTEKEEDEPQLDQVAQVDHLPPAQESVTDVDHAQVTQTTSPTAVAAVIPPEEKTPPKVLINKKITRNTAQGTVDDFSAPPPRHGLSFKTSSLLGLLGTLLLIASMGMIFWRRIKGSKLAKGLTSPNHTHTA